MKTTTSLIPLIPLIPLILAGGAVLVCGSVSAADAKANWSQHCAKCHADDGSGNTPSGRKLGIRDYRDPKVQAELKERDMIKATRGGYRAKQREVMKPYGGVLSDEEIRDLVAHIRTMKKS